MNIRRDHPGPLAILAVLLFAGCGGEPAGPKVYPVTGKILVDGKPAENVQVTFHPVTKPGAPIPTASFAVTDADGTFRPTTRMTGDGAPAGDYVLTIVWPAMTVDHGEPVAGRDQLKGRYRSSAESNLKVTIKEGENSLPPFDLKSSP